MSSNSSINKHSFIQVRSSSNTTPVRADKKEKMNSVPSTPQTVQIEHKIATTDRNSGFLGGASRPVVLGVGLLLFLSMGGVGFLLDQFLRVPGLKSQVQQLEEQVATLESQVGRLEGAVDELAVENDRYENLNVELNITVQDLSLINGQLNRSNAEFSLLNDRLDASNAQLAGINLELINRTLEFQEQNEDLLTVVDFLNETTLAIDGSLKNITSTLASQIEASRQLTIGNYEVLYLQQRSNWDCDFFDYFLGDHFTTNRTAPIGPTHYEDVRLYVQFRLMDGLCLDMDDWEDFMMAEEISSGVIDDMTTVNLIRGVQRYTGLALGFFYPNSRDASSAMSSAVTYEEWADAGFKCSNLGRTFQWEAL